MKTIMIDVDSTLNDHYRRIRRWTPGWPNGKTDPKAFTREETMKDKPLPGAVEFVQQLDQQYSIKYLSARGWPGAAKDTKDWLAENDFPVWPDAIIIVASMQEKIAYLSRAALPHFYVDDFTAGQERAIPSFRADIAQQIQAMGIHVICFRGDWPDVIEQIKYYEGRVP